jgi:hypothetical protein
MGGAAIIAPLFVVLGLAAGPAVLEAGFAPPVSYAVGSSPLDVAVSDFNGDSRLDLAVASQASGVSILLGNPDGTFQPVVTYPVGGTSPFSVAVGDFNGDAKVDLAVSCQSGTFTTSIVSVLLGNGDGTFQAGVGYGTGTNPVSVAAGDLNGDGKLDLITANTSANNVSILLGNGDGTFQASVEYPTGGNGVSVAVGDLSGDGRPDLAIANGGFDNVAILIGNGNGTFQAPVPYAAGTFPQSVIMGDLDEDGTPDLAVANRGSNNVSILLGNGNGTFQAAVDYEAGNGPTSLVAADLDGDGRQDLAVTNVGSDNISLLAGDGTGAFKAPVNYGAGTDPFSIVTGDFDSSGVRDLAAANWGSHTVSVLLNDAVTLSIQDVSVTEGTGTTSVATFTVALSAAATQAVTVGFSTADGTAISGSDYTATFGTLTFPAGTTTGAVAVAIAGDSMDEPDENFVVNLSSPINAAISDGQGIGTILDNDPQPSVSIDDCAVVEGNTGSTPCGFTASLSTASGFAVSVGYATADGTATGGSDYASASGTLTFAPGVTTRSLPVQVLGDLMVEVDETFRVSLAAPTNATLGDAEGLGTIGDDDGPSLSSLELLHGSALLSDLEVRPDLYRIAQPPYSSHEVTVDATSGDIVPVLLQRLAGDNATVLQTADPTGAGPSVSLRWENTSSLHVVNQHIRMDGSCPTPCGLDDVYRIRAFETTYAIPRFNNTGSQVTVLLLQNPRDRAVTGHIWFWSGAGSLLGSQPFSLAPRQALVLNTSTVSGAAGHGGAVTITHDGSYGDLAGKAVALEPSTGFSFDSPMAPKPR